MSHNDGYIAHVRAEARRCTRHAMDNMADVRHWLTRRADGVKAGNQGLVRLAEDQVWWHVSNAAFWRRQAASGRRFARALEGKVD